jgi:hypothetical protein
MPERTILSLALAGVLGIAAWGAGALTAAAATAPTGQFDQAEVPAEMGRLDFMVGEWTVEGAFRTPDHVAADRTLWYLTRGGGVTRFDGQAWTAYARGDTPEVDAVLDQVTERGAPYAFTNSMDSYWAQDGFVLIVDEGRTSGTAVIYYDTGLQEWVSSSVHAPTNTATSARAPAADGVPVFAGRGSDRRGERVFQRRYEIHDQGHFTIHTDVSFDGGVTWIDDQVVAEVRRR